VLEPVSLDAGVAFLNRKAWLELATWLKGMLFLWIWKLPPLRCQQI